MFWFFHGSFSAPIIKLLLHVTVVALVHVFYAFTLVNWRCSRDDAAETAAATAAVDAAAGLTTAPGWRRRSSLLRQRRSSQVRALVDAHILLPAVVRVPHIIREADPPRHDRTRAGHRASHAQPDTASPALPPPQATHSFSRASRSRAPDRGSASFCSTGVSACPSFGRRARSSTGRSRRRRSTSGAG